MLPVPNDNPGKADAGHDVLATDALANMVGSGAVAPRGTASIATIPASLRTAAMRYRVCGRAALGWARGKLLHDPVYPAVLSRLPETGVLVDMGCGEGYLLAAARAYAPELALVGIDHDERRLAKARRTLLDADADAIVLHHGDLRTHAVSDADVITLLDVLHYLSSSDQDMLIRRAAEALRPGGILILRDVEPGRTLRARATVFAERIARVTGRHRGHGLFFRPIEKSAQACRDAGLVPVISTCEAGTPFANRLIIARRPDGGYTGGHGTKLTTSRSPGE